MSLALFHAILFYMFAAVAVGAALAMVAQRNPTYSAFALIVTLIWLYLEMLRLLAKLRQN